MNSCFPSVYVCVINAHVLMCVCKGVSCDYFVIQGTLWNALALGKQVRVITCVGVVYIVGHSCC